MKRTFTRFSAVLVALLLTGTGWAQQQTPLDIALRHLEQKHEAWGLADGDTKDVVLRDQVHSRHNGTTHFYFNQRHAGIEVYNAINGVHVQEGKVVFSTNRFTPNLAEKLIPPFPASPLIRRLRRQQRTSG